MKKLNIAVVIVSDTRTDDTDKSGKKLKSLIETDGHSLVSKIIISSIVISLLFDSSKPWISLRT